LTRSATALLKSELIDIFDTGTFPMLFHLTLNSFNVSRSCRTSPEGLNSLTSARRVSFFFRFISYPWLNWLFLSLYLSKKRLQASLNSLQILSEYLRGTWPIFFQSD